MKIIAVVLFALAFCFWVVWMIRRIYFLSTHISPYDVGTSQRVVGQMMINIAALLFGLGMFFLSLEPLKVFLES